MEELRTSYKNFSDRIKEENEKFDMEYPIIPLGKTRSIRFPYFSYKQYPDGLAFKEKDILGFVYTDLKHRIHHTAVGIIRNEDSEDEINFFDIKDLGSRIHLNSCGFIPVENNQYIIVAKRKIDWVELISVCIAVIITILFF